MCLLTNTPKSRAKKGERVQRILFAAVEWTFDKELALMPAVSNRFVLRSLQIMAALGKPGTRNLILFYFSFFYE